MSKGEQTRAAILDRAVGLASRVGLEGLSIGGLAKESGLSKSGLYAHFDSKRGLQSAVLASSVQLFVQTVVAPAVKEPRGIPRVRALFEKWLQWSRHPSLPGGCPFIAAATELDDRPGPLRDELVGYQAQWIQTLAKAAEIAVEEGQFRADLDVRQFAFELYGILLAYHLFGRLIHDREAERRARVGFDALVEAAKP